MGHRDDHRDTRRDDHGDTRREWRSNGPASGGQGRGNAHRTVATRRRLGGAVALAAVALLAAGAPPASARATPAQKTPLTQTNRSCDGTVIGGERPAAFGHAVMTRPASGKLVVSVSVAGARPDTTYAIRVIQLLPGDADCHGVAGYLTTDSLGAGRANVQEVVLPGVSRAWVDLNATDDFTDFLDGEPVSF